MEKISRTRWLWICSLAGAVAFGALVIAVVMAARPRDEHPRHIVQQAGDESHDDEHEGDRAVIPVQVIHPKRDPSLIVSVQQLASVDPFFRADLRARVAGVVKYVQKNINDPVKKGEVLIEIDVPDLEQEVGQKEAVVEQRHSDLKVARAQLRFARAAVDIAKHNVDQMRAEEMRAEATRDFRKKRWQRFVVLYNERGVDKNLVDEEERDYRAAEAGYTGAQVAVKKALADVEEKNASLESAAADIELKQALIRVAQKDRDKTQALQDYAKIRADFDGVITERNVDVGTFVQNAATAQTRPLMTITRNDIVTVVMKLPDNYALGVTPDTDAVIQVDELPGVLIRGKVTRYAPLINDKDRTMRVEVDLYNSTPEKYQRYVSRGVAGFLAPLGAGSADQAAVLTAAGRNAWERNVKDGTPNFPLLARTVTGKPLGEQRLIPGMSGYMRLELQKFKDCYLIPSSAVFSRGGKPYVSLVEDGFSHLVPVRVYMNDGKLARVCLIVPGPGAKPGERELLQELTGDEEIIASRQVEIGDGQPVRVTVHDW